MHAQWRAYNAEHITGRVAPGVDAVETVSKRVCRESAETGGPGQETLVDGLWGDQETVERTEASSG